MAENPAMLDDVRTFYPGLTPAQHDQARRLIRVAWARLRVIPGLKVAQRMDAGELDCEVVSSVIGEMVSNVLRNPEGARSRTDSMSIDDYQESSQITIDQARSEGALYPTATMLSMLRENRARGAWTVVPR